MGRFKMQINDYDAESSTASFQASDITAANADAEYAAALALQQATMDVSRGKLIQTEHVAKTSPQGVGRATSEEAQREEKALVKYYDDTTFKRAVCEIPCADMSQQHPAYPGVFWLKGAASNPANWDTFVTNFEAFVPGPSGNTSVVEEVIHVGRNL